MSLKALASATRLGEALSSITCYWRTPLWITCKFH